MKFYRALQPFKLISFDLDDTLYDNSEVIRLAVEKFLEALRHFSQLEISAAQWGQIKTETERQNPILCEDVIAWRKLTIQNWLKAQGKSAAEIQQISDNAMAEFVKWRHKIDVPAQSIEVLNQLKTRYPIVAITNGNVDPNQIGLTQFEQILRGGEQGRAKPHAELFHKVAAQYGIPPQEILHVGDHLISDVQGAINAGCQSVWINLSGMEMKDFPTATILPTLEIRDLKELLALV